MPASGGNTFCAEGTSRAKAEGRSMHESQPGDNMAGPRSPEEGHRWEPGGSTVPDSLAHGLLKKLF